MYRADSCARTAHPRSRGEHYAAGDDYLGHFGSSPLARGTRTRRFRWCSLFYFGSSPLARGTRQGTEGIRQDHRLIPARAGNTAVRGSAPCLGSAHPRSRGEHTSRAAAPLPVFGSSPLARGTRYGNRARPVPIRLIPARAGNTRTFSSLFLSSSAHPRSRGEHHAYYFRLERRLGSSPLARGTRPGRWYDQLDRRLIPARAGNTWRVRATSRNRPAHPRSRGEHS